jgi:hypothetical protein
MNEAEPKKICRICGEDLHHKQRHKSHDGTYLCLNCTSEAEQKRRERQVAGKSPEIDYRRLALYVVLAAIGCVLFWLILDMVSTMAPS